MKLFRDPRKSKKAVEPAAPEQDRWSSLSANRVKTRLLGFDRSDGSSEAFDASKAVVKQKVIMNAVGWIIVVDGPGRGACFPLLSGMSQIGRDDDQQIQLDFGDSAISIGETELRLVVLCDSEFNWNEEVKDEDPEASAQDSDEFILKSGTSEKTPHEAAPANQAAPNAASQADRSEE